MRNIFKNAVSALLSAAFVLSGTVSAGAFEIRDTEPQRNENAPEYIYYYSNENIFEKIGYGMANCTAYAWGRIYEILGEKPKLSIDNAGRWYKYNMDGGYYSYGSEPKQGAVACWDKFDNVNGHVAVVENVSADKNMVTLSESQYNGRNFYSYTQTADSSGCWKNYRFLGYIYPDDTQGKFYGDSFRITSSENNLITFSENLQPEIKPAVSNTALQNFRFEPLENGNYRIWSASADVILESDGFCISFSDEIGSMSEWSLYKESNGKYTICCADDSNIVLTSDENGLTVSSYCGNENQLWNINRVTGITPLMTTEREISFSIDISGARTDYMTYEFLDLSGADFKINNRSLESIDMLKLSTEYDFSTAGEKTVTVKYGDFSAEFQVTVSEPEAGMEHMRNSILLSPAARFIIDFSAEDEISLYDLNGDNKTDAADILLMF